MAIRHWRDAALNDSDKTFTIPKGKIWTLHHGRVELVTTATAGNRQIEIVIADASANEIARYTAGGTQAASLTRQYVLRQGEAVPAALAGTVFVIPIAFELIMLPQWTVRVYDSAAVDAAADDMTVELIVSSKAA